MPILWRYLLRNTIKVFSLAMFGFIALLILMKMQQIARFATLGTSLTSLLLFILYQLPAILPTAIPISCLISAYVLTTKLTSSQELTSLRAQGISIKEILYPIKMLALFLTLFNFVIVSELTPNMRVKSKNLVYKATATNPLLLMRMNKVSKVKNSFADLELTNGGNHAKNVTFAFINPKTERLNLILANQLSVEDRGMLIGDDVAFVSNLKTKEEAGFDHLIVENYGQIKNSSLAIAGLLHESDVRKLSVQKLGIKSLLVKLFVDRDPSQTVRALLEIGRRLYLALMTFSFTMLGAHFAIQIGRQRSIRPILIMLSLSAMALSCYIIGKSNTQNLALGLIIYTLPHIVIYISAKWHTWRIERGMN